MRHHILALLVCTLGLRLGAAEQLLTVTPQSLDGWSVVGADKSALAAEKQFILPAGAQLSREFSASAVIVRLVSKPVFSEIAAEWPILEVGPVVLALIGRESQGRLMLVVNEDRVIDLPWPVVTDKLNPAVDLILAYDPLTGAGLIGLMNKLKSFASSPTVKPVEVVLSAGEHTAWPQDSLSVLLLADDPPPPGARSGVTGDHPNQHAAVAKLQSALDSLPGPAAATSPGGPAGTAASAAPDPDPISTLEIFTPPSVRHGRAEAVRTLLARSRGK